MATDHPKAIKDYLSNNGFSNVIAGDYDKSNTDKAISVNNAPGLAPVNRLDSAGKDLNRVGIQVKVRGERDGRKETRDRAGDVMDQLQEAVPSGYDGIIKRGGITPLGTDDNSRPEVSINFIAFITE